MLSDGVIVALITAIFGLAAAIVSSIALRSGKRKEVQQAEVAMAIEAMRAMMENQQAEIVRLTASNQSANEIIDRLRNDLMQIGARVGDKISQDRTTVLLIEDADADAELTTVILMQHESIAHVSRAHTVAESAQLDADVIVTDLELGATSGMQTLCEVRKLHPHTPVIVLTNIEEVGNEARLNGAVDFVPKSWQLNDSTLADKILKAKYARVT